MILTLNEYKAKKAAKAYADKCRKKHNVKQLQEKVERNRNKLYDW